MGDEVANTSHIGTSGWVYPRWRGDFYPEGLPHGDELAHLSSRLSSVEVNATFYALQSPQTFRRWAQSLPEAMPVAIKGSRYITHMKRLRDSAQAMANFWASGLLELGHHLGPVLWQLPPTMAYDPDRLGPFLHALPRTTDEAARLAAAHDDRVSDAATTAWVDMEVRYAVEPRHPSFDCAAARRLLREQQVALAWSDGAGLPSIEADTTDFRYLRLHGRPRLYHSGYGEQALRRWAERVAVWTAAHQHVYVYFDNDAQGRAPHDAARLIELLTDGRSAG
jgi:uncharacterized protein YecE (DUF72 family)